MLSGFFLCPEKFFTMKKFLKFFRPKKISVRLPVTCLQTPSNHSLKCLSGTPFFRSSHVPNPGTPRPPFSQNSGTGPGSGPDWDTTHPCLAQNSWRNCMNSRSGDHHISSSLTGEMGIRWRYSSRTSRSVRDGEIRSCNSAGNGPVLRRKVDHPVTTAIAHSGSRTGWRERPEPVLREDRPLE